ncbi:hypothetical protein CORC01_01794 [Colletotrichum orchidophilum]|uniref:LPXTG-domain-containing protein n=1 Tax=Colletotrichum orchidophilum TaxID=1209926 RepID=A0A1G4BP30_9PEZI|nr:uncharacterized protein CORC01_01794 [Colletotrichum orchidophilum]OHF03036.1 hypothetical protein CORC01_01794 [Colletotrichum orchidophilum]
MASPNILSAVLFFLALGLLAMAAHNDNDDYDQCYFDAGYVGPTSLLPCLPANETDNGVSWCCLAGHNCVNQGCWEQRSGVTYQYGCNDPTYKDKNCPIKGGLDRAKSPWVGLVKCETENEGLLKYWACNHPDTCGENCPTEPDRPQVTQSVWPWEPQPLPPNKDCKDLGRRVLAVYAPDPMGSTGGVPSTYMAPADKPSPTRPPLQQSDTTTTSTSLYTSTSPSETSSSVITPPPSTTAAATSVDFEKGSSTIGTGAIAGITVSSTVVVVSASFAVFMLLRRRHSRQQDIPSAQPIETYDHDQPGPAELPDDKYNLIHPHTPSTLSEAGPRRPVSDMTLSVASPSPLSSPRSPGSPYYYHGVVQPPSELADQPRAIHEMPAINERVEMP